MAQFTIRDVEGMRQVRIEINNEQVRARKGAMSNTRGQIKLTPRVPGMMDIIRSVYNDEARIRPWYQGTGTILLQPSLGGYHLLDVVEGEKWVLEPGVYWMFNPQRHVQVEVYDLTVPEFVHARVDFFDC